ncbi:hypothetical protein VFPPC_16530 [Pochonia chlamydosporia 170]|uniref:Uncharacterized protein n=1 Tax=Pochonia chlamydosporia 170 TaxID=1380566 RepID=A0A179F859_METCM|nr:hypothetical protein VFPPC_16530 [Pochonia chlamydosporia 170]OAQ61607.1 hypothetical protein VFPPC_16530 [Pochonia chlamydosporia 170]
MYSAGHQPLAIAICAWDAMLANITANLSLMAMHTSLLSRAWPGLIGSGSSGVGSGWHKAFYYRTLEKG